MKMLIVMFCFVQAQQLNAQQLNYNRSYGRSGSSSWSSGGSMHNGYYYTPRSGVEVNTGRSQVNVTGLGTTFLMREPLREAISATAQSNEPHYSDLNYPEAQSAMARAKSERVEKAVADKEAENMALRAELEVANAANVKLQAGKEMEQLKVELEKAKSEARAAELRKAEEQKFQEERFRLELGRAQLELEKAKLELEKAKIAPAPATPSRSKELEAKVNRLANKVKEMTDYLKALEESRLLTERLQKLEEAKK